METLLKMLIAARRLWVGGPQNTIACADRPLREVLANLLC
jgi:hypothetical protein